MSRLTNSLITRDKRDKDEMCPGTRSEYEPCPGSYWKYTWHMAWYPPMFTSRVPLFVTFNQYFFFSFLFLLCVLGCCRCCCCIFMFFLMFCYVFWVVVAVIVCLFTCFLCFFLMSYSFICFGLLLLLFVCYFACFLSFFCLLRWDISTNTEIHGNNFRNPVMMPVSMQIHWGFVSSIK